MQIRHRYMGIRGRSMQIQCIYCAQLSAPFFRLKPQPATARSQERTRALTEAIMGQKRKMTPQPEPRKYKGVFWKKSLGQWMAQTTNPPGHKPRQQFVSGSLCNSQADSAAVLAKVLKKKVKDLHAPLGIVAQRVEKNTTQRYRGVIWREEWGGWIAQITLPKRCTPRQITVGGVYSTQVQAAQAMIKKMTELKMARPNGKKMKWTLADVKMKKAAVYRGKVAMREQLEKFKIWSNEVGYCSRIAKKNKNPGRGASL